MIVTVTLARSAMEQFHAGLLDRARERLSAVAGAQGRSSAPPGYFPTLCASGEASIVLNQARPKVFGALECPRMVGIWGGVVPPMVRTVETATMRPTSLARAIAAGLIGSGRAESRE